MNEDKQIVICKRCKKPEYWGEMRLSLIHISAGDLTEELCRRDAVGMFDKSNSPKEWGYARMFLATKYGEELASKIIEEVEK